ncbi:MAG: DUF2127 domain-containing protein [Terriglobia bacterium]
MTPRYSVQSAGAPPGAGTASGRLNRHIRILAILWLVWGFFRLVPGIGMLFFFRTFGLPFLPFHVRALMMPISAFVGVFFLAYAAAAFVAAWGLMERQPWGRTLTIVLGIISLIHVPFGTALGIYTLWVMWPPESEADYRRLSGQI